MNKEELLHLFDKDQRMETTFTGYRREEDGSIIRQIPDTGAEGYIIYSELTEETVQAAIHEQMSYFQKAGLTFEWKVYDYDKPANLKDKLSERGFEIGEPEAVMVMQLYKEAPILRSGIQSSIIRITDESGIDDIVLLEEAIWEVPHGELGEELKSNLADDPDHLLIYAAYEEGKVVSAAWMYLHKGTSFGSLWGGSTLPDYRNKGLYTSLLAVRAQAAWERGFQLLTVDASPMSRPILEKKGFDFLAYSYPCLSPK